MATTKKIEKIDELHQLQFSYQVVDVQYRRMIKLDENQEKSSETCIVREQRAFREMTEALRRFRNSRSEKSEVRRHDHRATFVNSSVCSQAEYEMVEDEDAFVEAPWRQEQNWSDFL